MRSGEKSYQRRQARSAAARAFLRSGVRSRSGNESCLCIEAPEERPVTEITHPQCRASQRLRTHKLTLNVTE